MGVKDFSFRSEHLKPPCCCADRLIKCMTAVLVSVPHLLCRLNSAESQLPNQESQHLVQSQSPEGSASPAVKSHMDKFGNCSQEFPQCHRHVLAATSLKWVAVPFFSGVTKGAVSAVSRDARMWMGHGVTVPSPTQARQCRRGFLCSPVMMDLARESLWVVLLSSHGRESLKLEQTRSKPGSFSAWVHREPQLLETPLTQTFLWCWTSRLEPVS